MIVNPKEGFTFSLPTGPDGVPIAIGRIVKFELGLSHEVTGPLTVVATRAPTPGKQLIPIQAVGSLAPGVYRAAVRAVYSDIPGTAEWSNAVAFEIVAANPIADFSVA